MKAKIYTVEEVSKMLNIHHRTVRRYIKEGKLKASKVGGNWRITENDLKELMGTKDFSAEAADIWTKNIEEFVNSGISDFDSKIQNCSIVDFYSENKEKVSQLCQELIKQINNNDKYKIQFQYIWDNSRKKARFIFWGDLEFVAVLFKTFGKYKEN